jgi:hypothetical protein
MVHPDREGRNMKRDVAAGTLLIVSAVAGMFVMLHHPVGHDLLESGSFSRMAGLNRFLHGLAIASVPMTFLGLMGLWRRLAPSELATAALVVWGFGGVAIVIAAAASGFVATDTMQWINEAEAASKPMFHALGDYTHSLNQAFAKVNVVASSVSLLLWAFAIEKSKRFNRAVGLFGLVVGGALLLAFFGGRLKLNVAGFGIVIFAQSAWLIWVGILLVRAPKPTA